MTIEKYTLLESLSHSDTSVDRIYQYPCVRLDLFGDYSYLLSLYSMDEMEVLYRFSSYCFLNFFVETKT